MKRIFHASAAALALALLAGTASAQTAAPAADTPAASDSTTHHGKDLGEMKATPAEKKAAHDKKQHVTSTAKRDSKQAAKQPNAAAPKASKHVEKNATDSNVSEPAKKL
jgi:hypothetical protein